MDKKILIGLSLISLFLMSAGSLFVSSETQGITVNENAGIVTVTNDHMTVKIVPDQAHVMWWYGNHSDNDEMYKLQLVKIQEFQGDDEVLDNQTELIGIPVNLIMETWTYQITELTDEVMINLTMVKGDLEMDLIMHIYNVDTPIDGTDQVAEAFTEVKFDIVIKNWDFDPLAKGVAIQTYLTEVQHRHRVQVRNGTLAENGENCTTMQFESEELNEVVAYAEWSNFATVYNSTDDVVDTVEVGQAYFDALADPPETIPGFAEGLGHLWITYPNYGDGYKLVHDPSIGINEEAFTSELPLYLFPLIGGLVAVAAMTIIIKRRK
ncbi:MAG: hypothetical protein FK734_00265 [Asgard group archaeon]|nr:hypothetical protein [Asgard group archaeon]